MLQIEKISLEEKFKFKGIKINSAESEGRNNFEGKTSGTEKELIINTTGRCPVGTREVAWMNHVLSNVFKLHWRPTL